MNFIFNDYYRKQVFILVSLFATAFSICHKIPNHTPSKDLEINLQGKPAMYVAGSFYKVLLDSKKIFTQFFMTTQDGSELGSFIVQNDDKNSKFLDDCENTVVEVSPGERNTAQARWASPMSGCTTFLAIIKTDKGWLSANKTLCALKMKEIVPKIDYKCCACDHAKYKIIFQGIWSPATHPKHFPSVLEFTHFSDLVGASHSVNYTMWREGMYASYGLKQLAEYGVVQEMELELKNASKHLRNLIKLSGLWYPNVNGNMTGIFRVDPRHNLLSLASMFGPSPDWIVGVSSLNLCQDDCSWVEEKIINLYPYDVGTDNGISYMSPKTVTDPQERIKRITPMYPDDIRSPFYNMDLEEINPPLAKLYIIREKIINKQCSDLSDKELMEQITLTENSEDEGREECKVTEYSNWSECSVTCGKGLRTRTRQYINEVKSKQMKCDRQLVSREMCIGQEPLCQGEDPDEDLIPIASGDCDVTLWTNWTDCSVTCGIGMRFRSRSFISNDERVRKKCLHISLMEKEKCMLPTCFMNKPIRPECRVSEWSEWSPCSATCGQAFMVRDRHYLSKNTPKSCNVELKERNPCPPGPDCPVDSKQTCKLDILRGPCRNNFTRYAFNKDRGVCETFIYGGCRGNTNNFETLTECNNICLGETKPLKNCVVSRWSSWSRCWPCPKGEKTKTRSIIRHPSNGGKACPELTKTIKCSLPQEFCQFNQEELDF